MYMYIHVLMRDEKEGRKKQAWSNKQQGKATQQTHTGLWLGGLLYISFLSYFVKLVCYVHVHVFPCMYNVPGERVAVLAGVLVLHDIGVISQFGTW